MAGATTSTASCRRLDRIEQIVDRADSEYFKREVSIAVDGRPFDCLLYEVNPQRVRERSVIGTATGSFFILRD